MPDDQHPSIPAEKKTAAGLPVIRTYEVAHLDCANCARKMADQIATLPEVDEASIDFATGRLYLKYKPETTPEKTHERIAQIIRSVETQATLVLPEAKTSRPAWHEALPRNKAIRFIAGAAVFVLALVFQHEPFSLAFFISAYLILGYDVLAAAWRRLASRNLFDENFLMSLATLGAFAIREYPEAVAVMLFYQIGEIAQDMAVNHSRSSIRALMNLKPEQALRIREGQAEPEIIQPDDIVIGDWLQLRPGDRVPVDGILIRGETSFDTSALTGESLLRAAVAGDEVLAGFVNGESLVVIEATHPVADSAVARIMKMVEEASARKAQAEQFITRFAAVYTPIMVAIAAVLAFVVPFLTGDPMMTWVSRALILLVISCPCALVLSVPLGYFAGLGAASSHGILIKGGQYLEKLATASSVVFDKTGTLTLGSFSIDRIVARNLSEDGLFEAAARLESLSSHPIARSIVGEFERQTGRIPGENGIEDYQDRPGYGILATLDGQAALLGNERLLTEYGIQVPVDDCANCENGITLHLVLDGQIMGHLHLSDQVRPEADLLFAELDRLGVRDRSMLTGDREIPAAMIAARLGLRDFRHSLLPVEKVEAFEELMQHSRGSVIFVGDGINDAPVLARADVGIALGAGRDAALESADVVLMGTDLTRIGVAIRIARKTNAIVRQNIALALGLKAFVLLLAVIGLGNVWMAVFADVGVAVIAVMNSLRILKV